MAIATETIREFVIAGHGNLEKVKSMLAAQPELLNVPFYWSETDPETALDGAAHVGNRAIAEYLLAQGAPLTFYAACTLGMTDKVREYLSQTPTLAATPGVHNISALFHAAFSGSTELADLLAAHGGADSRASLNHALHAAVNAGHLAMVNWLLAHGVTDVNSPNFEKKTPLQVALHRGHSEIADVLRAHGGSEAL
ncbi:MAG: ankyrin repeat domain-containing protein [Anaerolineae bacterium]